MMNNMDFLYTKGDFPGDFLHSNRAFPHNSRMLQDFLYSYMVFSYHRRAFSFHTMLNNMELSQTNK